MPIDLLMFYFLPLHLRTPFLALVGLIWPISLSYRRGAKREELDDEEVRSGAGGKGLMKVEGASGKPA